VGCPVQDTYEKADTVWLLGPLGMAVDWKTGRIEGDIDDAPADDLPERDITEDQEEHPAHTRW
jgi:hypothetical protein